MNALATLPDLEIQAAKAKAAFDTRWDELLRAFRHGNPDRVGNASFDAEAAGWPLMEALGQVFALASEIRCEGFESARESTSRLGASGLPNHLVSHSSHPSPYSRPTQQNRISSDGEKAIAANGDF